ncbi:MFS transporter [Candidatus Bathyarchaeota archaeon]|nr:MFS transporter [Candidatus Bathyarchaeota archaeon]MBT4320064.1 MFS transporter [Candidatus Bathyarchaeota archaeon]MBT4423995.1 MFS transporter [Candidatus Bathyarchaeota archaeon]MBT6605928.1 MFS transporter [Candidatus Bathyarchaeota archaeon]MBT7186484.1 MFS transporter [Candidatus Bathyarchaeota archaeon]
MPRPKWWSYNYTVLLITWMGWISIYLARSVLPPVLPVLTVEMGLTHAQSGLLETAYLIGYIISKVPAGGLSRRFGAKRVLAGSMVGYGASTLLISSAQGYTHVFILRFLVGLFQGVHLPVANALLSDRFGSKQGRAIGFNESGANVGNTLAFPVAVSILSTWGWRVAFIALSIPAFILAAVTLVLMKPEEESVDDAETSDGNLREYTRVLIPLALSHATYNLVLRTTFTFMPSFLVEFRDMTVASAGYLAMVLPFAGIFAKMGSGFILERIGPKASISGASALSSVFLAGLVMGPGGYWVGLNLIILGLALYSYSPIIYSSTTGSLPSNLKPVGLGVVTMFGNLVGAVSTSVVGALIDSSGYRLAFLVIAGVTVASSALVNLSFPKIEIR